MRRLVVLGIMLAAILGASQFASAAIQLASDDPLYGNSWATGWVASGPIDSLTITPNADTLLEGITSDHPLYGVDRTSDGGVIVTFPLQVGLEFWVWFPGDPGDKDLDLTMQTFNDGDLVDASFWHWDAAKGTLGRVSMNNGWNGTPVVPEPASIAIWSLAAGGLSLAAGFRSLRRRKFNEGGENAARPSWSDESRQGILRVIESGRRR